MDNWLNTLLLPMVMGFGGLITWFIRSRIEELRAIETTLREKQREVYMEILDPYIRLFANMASGKGIGQSMKKMVSYEYRKVAFELNLFGSDKVVQAHNSLLKLGYAAEKSGVQDTKVMMKVWGKLLLEIRESLGNKKTKLKELDMLHAIIKDAEEIWDSLESTN